MPPFSRSIFLVGMFLRDNIVHCCRIVRAGRRSCSVVPQTLVSRLAAGIDGPPAGARKSAGGGRGRSLDGTARDIAAEPDPAGAEPDPRSNVCCSSRASRRGSPRSSGRYGAVAALGAALEDYRIFDETLVNLIKPANAPAGSPKCSNPLRLWPSKRVEIVIKRLMALLEPVSILVIGA